MEELKMGLRAGLNFLQRNLFSRCNKQIIKQASNIQQPMTKVMTDSSTGIIKMEREITRNGQKALATVEKLPNGKTKISVTGGGDSDLRRTTTITREKGASIFGGDRVTVEKDFSKFWCYRENSKLVKEYNPQEILEHKELTYHKNIGNETHINHKSVQDRVYDEYPLKSGSQDMLKLSNGNNYIKHSLDKTNNYHKFADGASTNYTRAVQAKEQAALDAAKKAEADALAAKEAAEKAAAELKARQPRINIAKAFGKDVNELTVKETKLPNGTIERTFTDPVSGQILAKTQDIGLLHKEWIYGGKADKIFMKQFDKNTPYIVAKKGNYTQVDYVKRDYNWEMPDGKFYKEYVSEQYYNDGANALKRSTGGNQVYNDATGKVTVYDSTAAKYREKYPSLEKDYPDYPQVSIRNGESACGAYQNNLTNSQIQANRLVKELNKDAQQNAIDLKNLFSDYSL